MSAENSEISTATEENSRTPNASTFIETEDISVFDLETFQKQLSRLDGKKQKTPTMLSSPLNDPGPSTEKELVGDDLNKKEQNIVCECQPDVTGGAVPAVCSFSDSHHTNSQEILQDSGTVDIVTEVEGVESQKPVAVEEPDTVDNVTEVGRVEMQKPVAVEEPEENVKENRHVIKPKKSISSDPRITNKFATDPMKVGGNYKLLQEKTSNRRGVKQLALTNTQNSVKRPVSNQQDNQGRTPLLNSRKEVSSAEKRTIKKRPSMIPKLSRPNTSAGIKTDSYDMIPLSDRNCYGANNSSSCLRSRLPIANSSSSSLTNEATNISVKMLDLKERLKMTTTLLRKKINSSTKTDADVNQEMDQAMINPEFKTPLEKLHESVDNLKKVALNVPTKSNKQSKKYVQQLLAKVDEIKEISKMIYQNECSSENMNNETENKTNKTKHNIIKDNKIHIKFMPGSHKNEKKTKKDDEIAINAETTHPSSVAEPEREYSSSTPVIITSENTIQQKDSMDGVFIPTLDPPKYIEDEEDESNGLDITITFPELNPNLSTQPDSHLSVKVSDISEEALRKLKRCPKDFTLRMDFVQGKVIFQSGKAPENNFLMGPDLKFTENPLIDQKSDLIEIKPSTECTFPSQVIPVENIKVTTSAKSLKSTDSELFKVVKLPFLYKNPSMSTVTKSCITFQNDNIFSMAIIARHVFKSMPHIASLTNLFDNRFSSLHHAVLHSTEKRRKNRPSPKKAITSSTM